MRVPAYQNLIDRGFTYYGDCILSNATLMCRSGYRHVWWKGKAYKAHRVAYEEWIGPIPDGRVIDHICHNEAAHRGECEPGACLHRSCVNPLHLQAKTQGDHISASPFTARGGPLKGAAATQAAKTHCKQDHEFTERNTYIFHNQKTGYSTRQCRICRKANIEKLRQRNVSNGLTQNGDTRIGMARDELGRWIKGGNQLEPDGR